LLRGLGQGAFEPYYFFYGSPGKNDPHRQFISYPEKRMSVILEGSKSIPKPYELGRHDRVLQVIQDAFGSYGFDMVPASVWIGAVILAFDSTSRQARSVIGLG